MKLDLRKLKLRKVNETLQSIDQKRNNKSYTILNPEGNHDFPLDLKLYNSYYFFFDL